MKKKALQNLHMAHLDTNLMQ